MTAIQINQTSDASELERVVREIIALAKKQGASAAEVAMSSAAGFTVNVRKGEVDTVEYNRDKGLGLTVYFGQRKGSASSTDTSPESLVTTVQAACDIARYTGEDACAGLADAELMASDIPDLALCYPWNLTPEQAIDIARECEALACKEDPRITNSEGASVASYQSIRAYANSHGFDAVYPSTRHSVSCCVIAEQAGKMQRDYSYTVARDASDLRAIKSVAQEAAERTVKRLGGKKISTRKAPILFAADLASGLLGSFCAAIRGTSQYRKSSFLLDHLDKQVFAKHIRVHEQPHLKKALGSAPFDGDGVATCAKDFVKEGYLKNYILDAYTGRKLGMPTTGNAGGVHNLFIEPHVIKFNELLKQMGTGLLVTEVMGHGINIVTGDYSRGAAGFWVENGEIQYPVQEVTIAGNLRDMFLNLVAVADDVDRRGSICSGSMLIEEMMIAGD